MSQKQCFSKVHAESRNTALMEKTTAQRDGNHSAAVRATYGCDVHSSFKKEKTEIAIRKKKIDTE